MSIACLSRYIRPESIRKYNTAGEILTIKGKMYESIKKPSNVFYITKHYDIIHKALHSALLEFNRNKQTGGNK